jgi:hypothetical protein
VWRSLVAHLHGVQGVEGSNPFTPTKNVSQINGLEPQALTRFALVLTNPSIPDKPSRFQLFPRPPIADGKGVPVGTLRRYTRFVTFTSSWCSSSCADTSESESDAAFARMSWKVISRGFRPNFVEFYRKLTL